MASRLPISTAPRHLLGTVKAARRPCLANRPPGAQAGRGARPLMAQVRAGVHELPTPRSMARKSFRVHVWCKSCRHAKEPC
jgi:hypothetical protein